MTKDIYILIIKKIQEDRVIETQNQHRRQFDRRQQRKEEPAHQINEFIKDPVVRVVGEGFEPKICSIKEALKMAYDEGFDLVKISPNANPPVCKVMDYQKFLYEQKKKEKERKAKSAKMSVKEIRLGPQTDDHDFDFKLKHAQRFLSEGNKVKVEVFFKGRTIVYKEQGEEKLLKFADALLDYGKPEMMPKLEGKKMMMIITPIKKK